MRGCSPLASWTAALTLIAVPASMPSNKILRPKRAPTSVKHVMAPCAAKHFAGRVSIQQRIHFAGPSLRFIVTYHLHISKYVIVRDSVRQGSKFGPESRPNPEKQYLDPFVKMCSMGEHISNPWYHWRTLKLGKADSGHLAFKAWEHACKSLFSHVTTTSRLLNCTENKPFENQSNLFTYQDMDVFTLSLYCFILDTLFPSTCYVQNTAKHCKNTV